MKEDSILTERRTWYVRQITRNILLGRLHPEDEISPDSENWQLVAKHRELYPDVLNVEVIDEEKLKIARMQADERIAEQRTQKKQMTEERRLAKERRADEPVEILMHRKHRKELQDAYREQIRRPKMPVLSVLLVVIVIVGFGFVLKPDNTDIKINCSLPPAEGVNWSNCHFINLNAENQVLVSSIMTDATFKEANLLGAKLTGSDMAYVEITESDLSYADLERARLIGANLKYSDLRYANLKDADLSYADLNHALLAGANINNTKFDHAIWIDGKECSVGSIGMCRTTK